jgi:hypothetical protein
MSEANTDPRSVATDATSGQADRYAHGTDIVAQLRARAIETIAEANETIPLLRRKGLAVAMYTATGIVAACETFLEWLDDLSVCDAASTDEARKPNA